MPTPFEDLMHIYGSVPLEDRVDIRGEACVVFDFRAETGGLRLSARAKVVEPPHRYTRSVYEPASPEFPTAEIIFMLGTRVIHLVGESTGRTDVIELTPEQVKAAANDPRYRDSMQVWIDQIGDSL